jgi:hypothetical protein
VKGVRERRGGREERGRKRREERGETHEVVNGYQPRPISPCVSTYFLYDVNDLKYLI